MFDKAHYSLSKGKSLQLTYDKTVVLESNNPNIKIRNGAIYMPVDSRHVVGEECRGIVTAKRDGVTIGTCKVTIVGWTANILELEKIDDIGIYHGLIEIEDWLYGYTGGNLYKTKDGFVTRELVGASTAYPLNKIYKTPLGFIAKGMYQDSRILFSQDMLNWEVCFTPEKNSLYHGFDYYYDGEKLYIFSGEYSAETAANDYRHKVHKGVIHPDGTQTWEIALEFYTRNEYIADNTKTPACRHIHAVQVDKKTGYVYVGAGDSNPESNIYESKDLGETFHLLGGGDQSWRTLAFWFTDDYIYFNTDSDATQYISQVSKSTGFRKRTKLDNGSMWYTCDAVDDFGNEVVILSQAQEGKIRDYHSRLYSIQEKNDELIIHELLSFTGVNPDIYSPYTQLEPKLQDRHGNIYFNNRETGITGVTKMKFKRKYRPLNYNFLAPQGFSLS